MIFFYIALISFGTSYAHDSQQLFSLPSIYAPWRDNYYSKTVSKELPVEKKVECPFCNQINADGDEQNYILARMQNCVIMLNRFPYTKGHILIIPYRHVASLVELSSEARSEMMELATLASTKISTVFQCQGFNIGFNIGNCSGASIPDHVHMQVVPRYPGNLSFMHTIAHTDVICYDIEKVYEKLKAVFVDLSL